MIRKYCLEDIDNIVSLEEETLGTTLGYEMLKNELSNDMSYIYVYEDENKIIGYISTMFDGYILEILNICVDTKYQLNGVGTKLLTYALDFAYAGNATSSILEVRESNKRAIHVYEKFGFKNISVRKGYYSNGENAIVMQKLFMPYEDVEDGFLGLFSKLDVNDGYIRVYDDIQKDKYANNFYEITDEENKDKIIASLMDKPINGNLIFDMKNPIDKLVDFEMEHNIYMHAFMAGFTKIKHKNNGEIFVVNESNFESVRSFLYEDGKVYGEDFAKGNSDRFIDMMKNNRMTGYIVKNSEEIVGFAWVYKLFSNAKIEDFFVLDKYQHQGFGTTLFDYIVDELKKEKITDLFLCADYDYSAKDLYSNMGFKTVGECYNYRKV